jgi:hypothetical protein
MMRASEPWTSQVSRQGSLRIKRTDEATNVYT